MRFPVLLSDVIDLFLKIVCSQLESCTALDIFFKKNVQWRIVRRVLRLGKKRQMEGINKSGLLRLGKRQGRANTSLRILETRKEEKGNHRIFSVGKDL